MVIQTKFKDLVIIQNKKHKDKRGYFQEIFSQKQLKKKFIFTVMSFSKKKVLRGLHLQTNNPQGKLVTVIKGSILDVVVDLRKKSKTFLKHYKIILSDRNSTSIYIPPGFAHGFYALRKENYIFYSCTKYRSKKSEITIKWNDENLKIKWPTKKPILSFKDKKGLSLKEFLYKK